MNFRYTEIRVKKLDQQMNVINLNKDEYDYLINSNLLQKELESTLLDKTILKGNNYKLSISEETSDVIRDLAGERLQVAGFAAIPAEHFIRAY